VLAAADGEDVLPHHRHAVPQVPGSLQLQPQLTVIRWQQSEGISSCNFNFDQKNYLKGLSHEIDFKNYRRNVGLNYAACSMKSCIRLAVRQVVITNVLIVG
jgi:hypothetical protein